MCHSSRGFLNSVRGVPPCVVPAYILWSEHDAEVFQTPFVGCLWSTCMGDYSLVTLIPLGVFSIFICTFVLFSVCGQLDFEFFWHCTFCIFCNVDVGGRPLRGGVVLRLRQNINIFCRTFILCIMCFAAFRH